MRRDVDDITICKIRAIETEILIQIDRMCRENNITYSLAYGTALGAVRHGGFIPWDDDTDIFMERSEYERFRDVWDLNPIEGLFLQGTRIGDETTINHTKVCKEGTVYSDYERLNQPGHNGIWIDVFPLERVPKNKLKKLKIKIWAIIRIVCTRKELNTGNRMKRIVVSFFIKRIPQDFKKSIRIRAEKELTKYQNYNGEYKLVDFSALNFKQREFEGDIFENIINISYENSMFCIIEKYEEMLKTCYGNYKQLPPKSERVLPHIPDVIVV